MYPLALLRMKGDECGYTLPTFTTTVWHLFMYILFEEIGFYYSHRYGHAGLKSLQFLPLPLPPCPFLSPPLTPFSPSSPPRLLHHPLLYKHIHKTHHEWTAPIGIVSFYCHPLEQAISNNLPATLGPLIMGSHLSVASLWYVLAIVTSTISHSGYHFPFLPSPEAHDFHHLR